MTPSTIPTTAPLLEAILTHGSVTIAVDTEFHGAHTLTIQSALRLHDGTIAVQVYHSPALQSPPPEFTAARLLETLGTHGANQTGEVLLRPTKAITNRLSPLTLIRDLLGVSALKRLSRGKWQRRASVPPEIHALAAAQITKPLELTLVLVGHFLPADFARLAGRKFWRGLLRHRPGTNPSIVVDDGKVIGLRAGSEGNRFRPPVVEYASLRDGRVVAVRLTTCDTAHPFGSSSLDDHARTFVGVGKSDLLGVADKANMLASFRARPLETYLYAARDAILTLLVHEGMVRCDREVYRRFDVVEDTIPKMRRTLGGRACQFLTTMSRRHAVGSDQLRSNAALMRLMALGGTATFEKPRVSRFGAQTAQVHGGLLFSRTPTKFWIETAGMLRDVDLTSCYPAILSGMEIAWGRPIVWEPGRNAVVLKNVVKYLQGKARKDMWFVRVTGNISTAPNTLIPSALGALTSENIGRRRMKEERVGARLFTARIESGIVTHATWLLISAMPREIRSEYENLQVDSVVFYPQQLVAANGSDYDRLVAEIRSDKAPWSERLDLNGRKRYVVEHLTEEFVALRYPIGEYARLLTEYREEAKKQHGAKSGQEKAWKSLANTIYGVLASKHTATGNVVAANVTTGTARALAFTMISALNGLQVITDGCTYRRDRIPACTYAECLRRMPDYPLRHADIGDNIPFHDPHEVPDDDTFTEWYRLHAQRFFGTRGEEFQNLLAIHRIAHKLTAGTDTPAFDAMAVDGPGSYMKCVKCVDGSWEARESAMRGCGRSAKETLQPWIFSTYVTDQLTDLSPVACDTILLKYKEAHIKARAARRDGLCNVLLPLGFTAQKIIGYKPLRLSAFLFTSPRQMRTITRQVERFERAHGCGLEVLALRRSYGDREQGSLHATAEAIYQIIRAGKHDLVKALHLDRLPTELMTIAQNRRYQVDSCRGVALIVLRASMDLAGKDAEVLTGIEARLLD